MLLQRDVARWLDVTACTVKNTSPETSHLPAVHDFLGYQPSGPGRTFAETHLRRVAGLSQEQLAERTSFETGEDLQQRRFGIRDRGLLG